MQFCVIIIITVFILSLFTFRLCLSGKLVSQTTDGGKSVFQLILVICDGDIKMADSTLMCNIL